VTDTVTVPIREVLTTSSGPIAVCGSGVLHDAIRSRLDVPPAGTAPSVLVVVGADTSEHRSMAMPSLPVRWEPGQVLLGPASLPGVPGCHTCAERRRGRNRPDRAHWAAVRFDAGPGMISGITADLLAAVVAAEATSLARAPGSARTRGGLLRMTAETARITWHRVLPDPLCPACAALPADTPDAARIVLTPARKLAPDTFRVRDAATTQPALESLYSDPETGLVAHVGTGVAGGCVIGVATLEPATTTSNGGCGRTLNFRSARFSALTEALESYAGSTPRARRPTTRARYVDVTDQAVDPVTFGLYPDERHDLPGFPYRPYHPELELSWVWGYSFARRQPVLVPENLARYSHGRHATAADFVQETSNGCALGSCLVEAIFHGLLEVAERDAFLMTWYARMAAPRVDIDSATDRTIPLLMERIRHTLGYDVLAFDSTLEHSIPSMWVLAVDARPGPDRPAALCAAKAHPLVEQALLGALCELASLLGVRLAAYPGRDTTAIARLLADPDEVRTMEQHSALYSQPQAFDRFSFLPLNGPARSLADVAGGRRWAERTDLADDLRELVGRYLDTGLDVIVVDQTTSEHRTGGLSCVKVLVPGTLPMTFGHRFRRTTGIPRLLSVPRQLGRRASDLRPDEINPYPHPFP
jgi:ribosomal protein S12 methylthiotransferase accessory factor